MNITWEQFVDDIVEHTKDEGLREKLKPDIPLEDKETGFDSLDIVELAMMFEDKYDIELTETEMQLLANAGELHQHIAEKVTPRNT